MSHETPNGHYTPVTTYEECCRQFLRAWLMLEQEEEGIRVRKQTLMVNYEEVIPVQQLLATLYNRRMLQQVRRHPDPAVEALVEEELERGERQP